MVSKTDQTNATQNTDTKVRCDGFLLFEPSQSELQPNPILPGANDNNGTIMATVVSSRAREATGSVFGGKAFVPFP